MLFGKGFVDMVRQPDTAYRREAHSREHTLRYTSEEVAQTIAQFEAGLPLSDGVASEQYSARIDKTIAPGRPSGSGVGVKFMDIPYRPGTFPRTGVQPIDERLHSRMAHRPPRRAYRNS